MQQAQRTWKGGTGQITHHVPFLHIPDEDILQCGHICELPIENRVGRCTTDNPESLKIVSTAAYSKID